MIEILFLPGLPCDLLKERVPLLRGLDGDQPAALRHQLARLLRLDPAHPVAAEVVAADAGAQIELRERAGAAEICNRFIREVIKTLYREFNIIVLVGLSRLRGCASGLWEISCCVDGGRC